MKKHQALQLVGQLLKFKKNNVLIQDPRATIFRWTKGEVCKVVDIFEFEVNISDVMVVVN